MPCFVSTIEKVLNISKFEGKCGYSEISVAYNKNALNMDDVLKVIGKREEEEEVAPPIPPLAAPADIPAPSAPSSLEPSRRDLMRALWRNERIMHRQEQLILMLHPGLETSGLEQISSPKIS
ncbi:hypothetical protein PIB30_073740 [Stylosanthes scabra]|uniref:Uncharacterized protein n=1 Tax=Stylosanthes scabra TaxID=79078 RepID=A0ABU6UQ37_9FABA|nr:hypothetical protein [Stylosanthes scabra]